ncbi:mitotic-spindle organizing protein 1B [Acrasis kona]|uniref:Mitotic-spindle organizing protein 1B n=1 Tax=Acrasis kona TaxID=1008807 RepID=A0AAW2ZRE3_9EUKA
MTDHNDHLQEARETVEIAYELNKVLNSGLDRESLSILMNLIELGVNPEALAACVKEIQKESNSILHSDSNTDTSQINNKF